MEKVLASAIGAVAALIVVSFLVSYPIMLLWNGCLVPAVSGLNPVGWLQMWGISIIIGFLTTKASSK